jgi:predicted lipoprotein with Yx(FWY)xxD motif
MSLTRTKLTAVLAALAAVTGAAVATPSVAAPSRARAHAASGPATIQLRRTPLGMILVDRRGFTVYAFSHDSRNHDTCLAMSGCASAWPPVRTSGRPRAGRGVRSSLLGTIRIAGGSQVTYDGHALYGYSGDSSPGSTGYVGVSAFHGTWSALRSNGALVH